MSAHAIKTKNEEVRQLRSRGDNYSILLQLSIIFHAKKKKRFLKTNERHNVYKLLEGKLT